MEQNDKPEAPSGGMTNIQPLDSTIEPAKINVGTLPMPPAESKPQEAPVAPEVSAPVSQIPPMPSISSSSSSMDSSRANRAAFTGPREALGFTLLTLFTSFMFLTWGVGVNIWVKLIVLAIMSLASLYFSCKAYNSDNGSMVMVSLIISTLLVTATFVGGGTYVYYYLKFKQISNSFSSGYYD